MAVEHGKQAIADMLQKHIINQTILTLALATHPRLGEESEASLLAEDGQHVILQNIFEYLAGKK